jgi:phytoene dehydrogenase-like protein
MFRTLSAAVLGVALLAPVTVKADDDHRRERVRRYYDRDARDYHEWNDGENRAYRRYLQEQRREYRDFNRVNRDEQREYWRWRHLHPETER